MSKVLHTLRNTCTHSSFFSVIMAMEKTAPGTLSKSCILIIVIASVERFAYKGVASNMVTYMINVVNLSTSSAAKTVSSWNGVNSMLPLVSAILTDSYWDRYSIITVSSLLYVMGLAGLTLWALLCAWMPSASLFLPLYLISLGQGAYNPSLQAFGGDQLQMVDDLNCDKEQQNFTKKIKEQEKTKFFQWWYFGICSGSLLGNSLMSYIQDNIGWGLGFAIPTIAMALSVAFFFCGTRLFVRKELDDSNKPIEGRNQAFKVTLVKVFARKHKTEPSELEMEKKALRDDYDSVDRKEEKNSGKLEESPSVTRTILKLLPIWTMLLMFAVIFQQPATFFTKQGMAMKRSIHGIVIPPAMLQSVITISIILLMPLYEKLIIPILRVFTKDNSIHVLQRIGIGMILSIIAMVVAALVESKRLEVAHKGGLDMQLSVFWLLPQYIMLGISDVFTVVGMQEFFYTEVPTSMRTIGIALYLSVFGFGSFLSAVLISVIELITEAKGGKCNWFSDDMGEARLDKYYMFLAVLSSLSFLIFSSLCRYYSRGSNASANEISEPKN